MKASVREFTDTDVHGLGLFAFIFDSIGGVMFAKFLNLFSKNKVNPMVGAAGISAFPMSARVIEKMGIAEDRTNHLLCMLSERTYPVRSHLQLPAESSLDSLCRRSGL